MQAAQAVAQAAAGDACGAGQVAPHLLFVGQAAGRFHVVRVGAALPQRGVIKGGEAHAGAEADEGRPCAGAWPVEVDVGEQVARREAVDGFGGLGKFRAEDAGEGDALRAQDRRRCVHAGVAVQEFEFQPPAVGDAKAHGCRGDRTRSAVEAAHPVVHGAVAAGCRGAAVELGEAGIDELVAAAGAVGVAGAQQDVGRTVGAEFASDVELGANRPGGEQQQRAEDGAAANADSVPQATKPDATRHRALQLDSCSQCSLRVRTSSRRKGPRTAPGT